MQLYGSPGTRHRTLTAKHHHGAAGALLREAHSAQEILKAGIRAKGVESCVPLKMHHVRVAVGVGLFEPNETQLVFAESYVDRAEKIRREITLPGRLR